MEMEGDAYFNHLQSLLADGEIDMAAIDTAVRRVLELKFELGLFDNPYTDAARFAVASASSLPIAGNAAGSV